MSAPNFSYDRRCVLVRNEDFEWDNVPSHKTSFGNDRSYPSAYLDEYKDDFSTIAIVITSGYYADACIDIVDREDKADELLGYAFYYVNHNRKELLDDVCYFLGCTPNFANKFLKGCHKKRRLKTLWMRGVMLRWRRRTRCWTRLRRSTATRNSVCPLCSQMAKPGTIMCSISVRT